MLSKLADLRDKNSLGIVAVNMEEQEETHHLKQTHKILTLFCI